MIVLKLLALWIAGSFALALVIGPALRRVRRDHPVALPPLACKAPCSIEQFGRINLNIALHLTARLRDHLARTALGARSAMTLRGTAPQSTSKATSTRTRILVDQLPGAAEGGHAGFENLNGITDCITHGRDYPGHCPESRAKHFPEP
jgi:hypothetical protein